MDYRSFDLVFENIEQGISNDEVLLSFVLPIP